jgi:hypothetical protein
MSLDELLHRTKKQKELDTEFEKVEAMGSDDESQAIQATKSIMLEEKKKETEQENRELEYLHSGNTRIVTYNRLLAGLLIKKLRENDWPQGWLVNVAPDDIGVVMEITSPDKRYFRSAFKPTGQEKYDRQAVEVYVMRAQNTVDAFTPKQSGTN